MSDDKQVVIVTGGTYGIGRALTASLAAAGYQVTAFGLDAPQPGSTAANGSELTRQDLDAAGLSADILEADVCDAAQVDEVVAFALRNYGGIYGLVNNAAIHPSGTAVTTTPQTWQSVIAVNLTGVYNAVHAVLPSMIAQRRGAIVNVASKASWGQPNLFAYSASKGGVLAASFALAYDHLDDGIRVNVVVPSGVVTGMTESSPNVERFAAQSVAHRPTQPQDVAHAVRFLLSEEAATISGAVLNVSSFAGQGGKGR